MTTAHHDGREPMKRLQTQMSLTTPRCSLVRNADFQNPGDPRRVKSKVEGEGLGKEVIVQRSEVGL